VGVLLALSYLRVFWFLGAREFQSSSIASFLETGRPSGFGHRYRTRCPGTSNRLDIRRESFFELLDSSGKSAAKKSANLSAAPSTDRNRCQTLSSHVWNGSFSAKRTARSCRAHPVSAGELIRCALVVAIRLGWGRKRVLYDSFRAVIALLLFPLKPPFLTGWKFRGSM